MGMAWITYLSARSGFRGMELQIRISSSSISKTAEPGDPAYVERNLRKINGYLKLGYIIGETLILTFESESQPISTAVIENTVKHYFL